MAFRFGDSFDHYTTNAQMLTKWSSANTEIRPGAGLGRNSTAALTTDGTNVSAVFATKVFDNQATWICGMANWITNSFQNNEVAIEFWDSGTAQVGVYITTTGALAVKRGGAGGTTLGTTANTLSLNTYQYIEFKATINDSGSYEVKVDGASWLSGSGDTQNTANAYADTLRVSLQRLAWSRVEDLYLCDGSGSKDNNFLGDVRIVAMFPNAVGTYSQWTPTSGDNYTCVDETTPNGDTDYVSTSGEGLVDTYNFQNLPVSSGTIIAVQSNLYARKDDAGTRKISSAIYYNSILYSGSKETLSSTYAYHLEIFDTNPNTGVRWIVDEVNNAEFGTKLEE